MGVSHIDGRVNTVDIKRQRGKIHHYRMLRFALDGGGERTIKNAVVANEVAMHLTPGTAGRFYLYNQMDGRGVYAFRAADGSVVNRYPQHAERLFLVLIVLNLLVLLAYEFLIGDGAPLLVLIAFAIGVVGYFATRSMRGRAAKALAADNPGLATGLGRAPA